MGAKLSFNCFTGPLMVDKKIVYESWPTEKERESDSSEPYFCDSDFEK